MTEPRINWQGDKLYFHDADGGVWRVYDCILVGSRVRAVPLSDPRAVHREFLGRDGKTRRVLRFAADTPRAISPRRLDEQWRAAEPAESTESVDALKSDAADRHSAAPGAMRAEAPRKE